MTKWLRAKQNLESLLIMPNIISFIESDNLVHHAWGPIQKLLPEQSGLRALSEKMYDGSYIFQNPHFGFKKGNNWHFKGISLGKPKIGKVLPKPSMGF